MDTGDPAGLERRAEERAEAGDFAGALLLREQAFAALRAGGETRRAAWLAAYQIAFDHVGLFGNHAVASGWLERGVRLAEESGDCVEAGWVALARALHCAEPADRARWVEEAARTAARFADADLHFDTLAYLGLALVEEGQISAGMRHLDEAAAAAQGGEVSSKVVSGEIYCKLLIACETTLDVRRAEEWQQVTGPLAGRPSLAWASAICRMHYGGILVASGRWSEAEEELGRAVELYDASYRALRSAALVRLGELRVRQGRLMEAEQLLAGQQQDSYAMRPWARLQWARAERRTDRRVVAAQLERALRGHGASVLTVPTLALLAEMELGCGEVERARVTVARLTELTALDPVDALVGYARQAAGLVSGADDRSEAAEALEAAIACFAAARLPLEEACARLSLAELLATAAPELAAAEARTAAESFAWLGATSELDRATAMLRSLGGPARTAVRRPGELTVREDEVLALVAQGLSNPEIARRLFISPKTASHHVSNMLVKLGLRNRAEAAAWAAAHGRSLTR
ncbi:MAG: helix-turn-helix transcriptional regulator [Nocardioidaceae bacterium]